MKKPGLLLLAIAAMWAYSTPVTGAKQHNERFAGLLKIPPQDTSKSGIDEPLANKHYDDTAIFSAAKYRHAINLTCAAFKKDALFIHTKFGSFADFSGVTFTHDADFSWSDFHHFLFMSEIGTDSLTAFNFYNASFPPLIDFSHNKRLCTTVDFTNANFDSLKIINQDVDRRHFINLFNTDLNQVKIDNLHFRLCFYDPQNPDPILHQLISGMNKRLLSVNGQISDKDYDAFSRAKEYRAYLEIVFPTAAQGDSLIASFTRFYLSQGKFPCRLYNDQIDALYSRLLKNYDTHGQVDSYESLYTEYQDYLWKNKEWPLNWLRFFPKYWNLYGNEKAWILFWAPGVLALLTLITFLCYKQVFKKDNENKVVYHLKNIPEITDQTRYRRWCELRNAFIFTCVVFFSFSFKTENLDFKKPAFFYVVIINVSGLLCLAYLANFILQKS